MQGMKPMFPHHGQHRENLDLLHPIRFWVFALQHGSTVDAAFGIVFLNRLALR
jgi:hypothetical protein